MSPFGSFGQPTGDPIISFTDPPEVVNRDFPEATLAAMRRELAGIETRLAQLEDPGAQRPLDRLAYRQARNELEDYRATVERQIADHRERHGL